MLHYSHWDESEIYGVYTEDAMKKELIRYAEWGKEKNRKAIVEQEKRIETLKTNRYKLGQRDREIQEQQKQLKADNKKAAAVLKSERKRIARDMAGLATSIQNQEIGLAKMKSFTDDELAQQELQRSHLYFEEFHVLGHED